MRWFTADTHFNHAKIATITRRTRRDGTRFDTMDEHDFYLIGQINTYAKPNDELFILGDFAADKPGKYRALIDCRKITFIRGNHDRPLVSKNVFGELHPIKMTKLRCSGNSMNCVLCHYPMIYWDGSHRGWAHLYGHTHANREETMDQLMPNRRSLDVGVDNARRLLGVMRPFSEQELYRYFINRTGHDPQSFYDNLNLKG